MGHSRKGEQLTPIKAFMLPKEGSDVYQVDYANAVTLVCVAPDRSKAEWLIWSLSQFHNVSVIGEEEWARISALRAKGIAPQ